MCIIQVSDDLLDGLNRAIPISPMISHVLCQTAAPLCLYIHLEVPTDEELTRHDCDCSVCIGCVRKSKYEFEFLGRQVK